MTERERLFALHERKKRKKERVEGSKLLKPKAVQNN